MMTEVYHCPPSLYEEQTEYDIQLHWYIRNKKIENENKKQREERLKLESKRKK